MPQGHPTPENLEAVSCGFAGLARLRDLMKADEAIDGCHVHIKPLCSPDGLCYRKRKLFPLVILLAVCDHKGRFIDTYTGWAGSVHNSRALYHSQLYRSSIYPPPGHYPYRQRVPLPPTYTPPQPPSLHTRCRNTVPSYHSRSHSIIELAFMMTNTRFLAITPLYLK